ncbi:hypothetical protein [Litorimonas sp.]|jgi:hypothetical protein|uniref:hypothetical protein n=1 Tax=Litorimonas sp. TaxID=1892381 RepID=UPI003A8C532F|tara:strand:+ start:1393 stop:1557 length:165 start_codon:yes stop_codon:yes gene_type:complete
MSDNNGSGKGIYFIVGALVIAVLGLGYMYFTGQSADEPDLSIEVDDNGLDVDSN